MRKLIFAGGKFILAAGFLFTLNQLGAQEASNGFLLSGEVVYQEMVKMDIQLEGMDPQIAEQIPRERKSEKVLHFTEEEAMFENHEPEEPVDAMPMEGSGIIIKMQQPDNKLYMDLKNKKVIEQKEFMSRVFLIESELEARKWKISGNQRKILDRACQEAITLVDGKEVHAWFTPEIGVPVGPGKYTGLPGLVLAVEMNEGDRTLEAMDIELKPLEKGVLSKPKKGKKVTRDEYLAIVEEKMKEMEAGGEGTWHGSGGGENTSTVVIRIQQ
jgi:GLPGLI family protein